MVTNLHEEWVRRLHEEDIREELRVAAEIEVRPVGGAGNVRVREIGREILTTRGVMQSAPGQLQSHDWRGAVFGSRL